MFLILINVALAQNIEVIKESPQEIKFNEIIEINIHISNPYSVEKEIRIEEVLPQDAEVIEPSQFSIKRNDALEVRYYDWITTIAPQSIKTITYRIKPLSLGEYSIGSTKIIDNSNSRTYESNSITFKVNCNPDNICDLNENSLTCSEDCPTGSADGICNYKSDGICDPDCEEEPDCKGFNFSLSYLLIPFIILILVIILIWLLPRIIKKREKFQIQEKKPEIKYTNVPKENNQ